ncbi:MAG: hypothetical protein IKN97_03505 [Lachnospiraceae bacterium]|nr:hypothetical protein [Lachnospiraceae bacterium]
MILHMGGNMIGSFMIVERIVHMMERIMTTKYVYFNIFNWFGNLLNLALAVMSIIGMWRMFTKAGEHEWGAIVPFYNRYLLFKISDMKNWFWAELVLSIVYGASLIAFVLFLIGVLISSFSTVDYNSALNGTGISFIIVIISAVLLFILHIVRNIRLARNFHLGGGWVLGFLLLPGVFYMIVGCSGKIRFKDRLVSGLLPGQIPYGPAQGAYGYSQGAPQQTYNPYGSQNNYYNNPYNNPYAQGNPYNPQPQYGPDVYAQDPMKNPAPQSFTPQGTADQSAPLQSPVSQAMDAAGPAYVGEDSVPKN